MMERQALLDHLGRLDPLVHRVREETGESQDLGDCLERLGHKDLLENQEPMAILVYLGPLDYQDRQDHLEMQYVEFITIPFFLALYQVKDSSNQLGISDCVRFAFFHRAILVQPASQEHLVNLEKEGTGEIEVILERTGSLELLLVTK